MEGDIAISVQGLELLEFLPTPSHGGRLLYLKGGHLEAEISTHALTWRATSGCQIKMSKCLFLPTPSHGGRRDLLFRAKRSADFYPRPHMEGDIWSEYSQYTLPLTRTIYFTPRPPMAGHDCFKRCYSGSLDFYPRPHMEGDIWSEDSQYTTVISTHALTWRATFSYIEIEEDD